LLETKEEKVAGNRESNREEKRGKKNREKTEMRKFYML